MNLGLDVSGGQASTARMRAQVSMVLCLHIVSMLAFEASGGHPVHLPPHKKGKSEMSKKIKNETFKILYNNVGFKNSGFWLSPKVLEGLGSSGRLVGSISTYPGTCQCPWSRVMTKNPRGGTFSSGYGIVKELRHLRRGHENP